MKRGRHHIGPLARFLAFWRLLDGRHHPVLSDGWRNTTPAARRRHGFRAVEARRRGSSHHQVGGPQTSQGN